MDGTDETDRRLIFYRIGWAGISVILYSNQREKVEPSLQNRSSFFEFFNYIKEKIHVHLFISYKEMNITLKSFF